MQSYLGNVEMIVMKFGGSSVGNADRIRKVADIIKAQIEKGPIVVVSALGGMTDNLIYTANPSITETDALAMLDKIVKTHYTVVEELKLEKSVIDTEIKELTQLVNKILSTKKTTSQDLDELMSFGERLSSKIVSAYLSSIGVNSRAYNAYDIGMITDSNFGDADILPGTYQRIRKALMQITCAPVITGFIGKNKNGNITTMGRGGSDYTASIIGAAIGAKEIQIWTNTDGIMTADPKIVSTAKNIQTLSYEEEFELEALGAANLNPKGIRPAMGKDIHVRILNTFNPEHKGTLIHRKPPIKSRVASITYRKDIRAISITPPKMPPKEDFAKKIVETFNKHNVPIKTLSKSNGTISITVDEKHNTELVVEELGKIAKVTVMQNMAQISLVGNGLMYVPNITETISSSLNGIDAELLDHGSKINKSIVVKERYAVRVVRLLHNIFFGR